MDNLPAFRVSYSLEDETEEPSIAFELSDVELAAIGTVTVQWSYLEHVLSMVHKKMCMLFNEEVSKNGKSISFKRRLRAWFEFLKAHEDRSENTEFFLSLHNRIAALENERHKVIHGIWDYDPSNPISLKLFSTRENLEFNKTTNLAFIDELSKKIGQINFLLTNIPIGGTCINDLPQTGIVKDGDFFGYVHRSLMLSPEDREHLYPERARPKKGKTPTLNTD